MIQKLCGKDVQLTYYGTDYGGWAIDTKLINENDIVYSFGVGTDISFDELLIKNHNCTVFAFDPTPRSIDWVYKNKLPDKFKFVPIGVSNIDGFANFNYPPKLEYVSFSETNIKTENTIELKVNRIHTIMSMMKHDKIDILKMDIEGSEYSVMEDLLTYNIKPKIILVEFHHNINELETLQKFASNYSIYKKTTARDYYLIVN